MNNNSEQFNDILNRLSAGDYDTIRSYIRDTVRGEWGGLISSLEEQMATPISNDGPRYADYAQKGMPDDPFIEKGPEPTEREEDVVRVRPMVQVDIKGLTIRFGIV